LVRFRRTRQTALRMIVRRQRPSTISRRLFFSRPRGQENGWKWGFSQFSSPRGPLFGPAQTAGSGYAKVFRRAESRSVKKPRPVPNRSRWMVQKERATDKLIFFFFRRGVIYNGPVFARTVSSGQRSGVRSGVLALGRPNLTHSDLRRRRCLRAENPVAHSPAGFECNTGAGRRMDQGESFWIEMW